jgi:adenylate kinase family enzyme
MDYRAIVIIGCHSAGKTTLSQALTKGRRMRAIELGDGVRRAAKALGHSNYVQIAAALLEGPEPRTLARYAIRRARRTGSMLPVFVGPRTRLEVQCLESAYRPLLKVGINTPSSERRRRWAARDRSAITDQWEDRERYEHSWGTPELVLESDLILTGREVRHLAVAQILRLVGGR